MWCTCDGDLGTVCYAGHGGKMTIECVTCHNTRPGHFSNTGPKYYYKYWHVHLNAIVSVFVCHIGKLFTLIQFQTILYHASCNDIIEIFIN